MSPRALPDVALCCIDTRTPGLAVTAMRACIAQCDFSQVILFSDQSAEELDLTGITLIKIPAIQTIEQYSHFVLKEIGRHVRPSHVLIMQWDGFVVDAKQWRDEFLKFDYIGAPWIHGPGKGLVGNGGFSLRSKRLLDVLAQDVFDPSNPEDLCICLRHKELLTQRHQIRFAPPELALQFSCERGPWSSPFGFHGLFNLPSFMTQKSLEAYIKEIPPELCGSNDSRHLIRSLMKAADPTNAAVVLKKRIEHQGWTGDNISLWVRIFFIRFRNFFSSQNLF